ncbi:TPA: hypothetical protein ACXPD1_003512 [Klebsiella pneumoniae]
MKYLSPWRCLFKGIFLSDGSLILYHIDDGERHHPENMHIIDWKIFVNRLQAIPNHGGQMLTMTEYI